MICKCEYLKLREIVGNIRPSDNPLRTNITSPTQCSLLLQFWETFHPEVNTKGFTMTLKDLFNTEESNTTAK